ncbi:uncharacterized protein [Nothobranchius furzeri]|uniref:uncharacterized protein n=1 Tax=Nothobranchius furzeri TaxID=105023 RepID=UPI00390477E7
MRRRQGELQVPEIQALPQNTGTPRGLQPERPPAPLERIAPGGHNQQPAEPREISAASPQARPPQHAEPGTQGRPPRRGPSRAQGPRPHQAATRIDQAGAKDLTPPDPGATNTQADQGTPPHTRCGRGRGDEDPYHQRRSQERGGVKGPT